MATIKRFEDIEVKRCVEISKILKGFMEYLRDSEIRGNKEIIFHL